MTKLTRAINIVAVIVSMVFLVGYIVLAFNAQPFPKQALISFLIFIYSGLNILAALNQELN